MPDEILSAPNSPYQASVFRRTVELSMSNIGKTVFIAKSKTKY
nr:MAG TPA: hypothetical protein [Caudoviricetes sp.]